MSPSTVPSFSLACTFVHKKNFFLFFFNPVNSSTVSGFVVSNPGFGCVYEWNLTVQKLDLLRLAGTLFKNHMGAAGGRCVFFCLPSSSSFFYDLFFVEIHDDAVKSCNNRS